jgi:hypothetical protein
MDVQEIDHALVVEIALDNSHQDCFFRPSQAVL